MENMSENQHPDDFADILYGVAIEYGNVHDCHRKQQYRLMQYLKNCSIKGILTYIILRKGDHQYVDLNVRHSGMSNVVLPGFTTSSKTRPLIVAKMEEFMRNKLIKINSNRLLSEMKTFIWHSWAPAGDEKLQ